jgi:hypothetical protein|tara:strand:- start:27 stop:1472 length:1446 start_codon:yes stop_codon:yes gene_type:complete
MATTSNSYTGNGSTTNYSITFEYLKQDDVKASLDGTATTAFTFANATTLSFNSAPASGAAIRIFRDTDIDSLKATFFPGSAIKAEDLNDNFTQNNFATQESVNEVADANTTAESAVTTANSAVTTANAADTKATTALDNSRESDGSGGFNSAIDIANTASTTANTASTNASNAVTTANTASTNATTALNNSREDDGSGGFNTAIDIANDAATDAATATTTANNASTTANSASTTVTTYVHDGTNPAGDGVGSNPQGLAYAINQAEDAVATANAASTAVANAAFYSPIAALANLPSSPSDEDRVEVTNSTGVESSSDVSGVPSGFTGSSDLTVRLQYDSSTSKWEWQQYFAADPENRYVTNYLAVIEGDGTSSGQVGKITLNCSNNNHGVALQSPPHSAAASYTLTLPTALPTVAGQALTSSTSGQLSFTTVDAAFVETPQTISTSKTIAANINAGMMGPTVSLDSGVTITVGSNSILTVLS